MNRLFNILWAPHRWYDAVREPWRLLLIIVICLGLLLLPGPWG